MIPLDPNEPLDIVIDEVTYKVLPIVGQNERTLHNLIKELHSISKEDTNASTNIIDKIFNLFVQGWSLKGSDFFPSDMAVSEYFDIQFRSNFIFQHIIGKGQRLTTEEKKN